MSKLRFLENGSKYPRETRRVDLGDYHADLAGNYVDVWVNWSRQMSDDSLSLLQEAARIYSLQLGQERDEALAAYVPRQWQFHSEWWNVPLEDVQQLYQIDTTLYEWIAAQASRQRQAYAEERKKVVESSTPT